jgi:hypothetical protein
MALYGYARVSTLDLCRSLGSMTGCVLVAEKRVIVWKSLAVGHRHHGISARRAAPHGS